MGVSAPAPSGSQPLTPQVRVTAWWDPDSGSLQIGRSRACRPLCQAWRLPVMASEQQDRLECKPLMKQDGVNVRRDERRSVVSVMGHPIFAPLASVPLVCFGGALLTDIVYPQAYNMQWTNFSAWLITAGLVFALFATIIAVIDFFRNPRDTIAIVHIVLVFSAYVIELFNIFVHSRDAYTSVVPTGLTLSLIAVVLLLVGNWFGASLHYRPAARGQA